jgi:hypothetical protein
VNVGPAGAQGNTMAACSQTPPAGALGITDQFPMGCYWQFAKATAIGQMLSEGRMPFARRTQDRLWVDAAGNPPGDTVSAAGTELIAQLTALFQSENSTSKVVPPGTPNVTIAPLKTLGGATPDVLTFIGLGLDTNGAAGDPSFVIQPTWQACVDTGQGSCASTTQHLPVVGVNSIPATFQIPALTGNFLAELDSAGTPLVTQPFNVPSVPLVITPPLPPTAAVPRQGSFNLNAGQLISGGNGPVQWWVTGLVSLVNSSGTCTAAAPCSLTASPSITLMETDPTATSAAYTLNASDAVGKNQSASNSTIQVSSGLTANNVTGFVTENAAVAGNLVQASPGTSLDLSAGNVVPNGDKIVPQLSCDGGMTWVTSCALTTSSLLGISSATAAVSNTNVALTPPAGFATHPPSGASTSFNGQALTPLQLEYRLQLYGSGNTLLDQSSAATLSVQVRARVEFDTDVVANILQRPNSTTTNPYPSGLLECNSGGCHKTTPGLIDYNLSAQGVYCELVGGSGCPSGSPLTPTTDNTRKFVDPTDATNTTTPQSVFLRHPAELDGQTHSGGQRCTGGFTGSPMRAVTPSTCDLITILQWIEDGANDF